MIDFERDLRLIFSEILGYSYTSNVRKKLRKKTAVDLAFLYFNWEQRLVTCKPRNVFISMELREKLDDPDFLETISPLIDKIRTGNDLTPHLSKRIKVLYTSTSSPKPLGQNHRKEIDILFSNSRIHHLHISTGEDPYLAQFTKRRSDLLYVIFVYDNAYLINVASHGYSGSDCLYRTIVHNWSDKNLLLELKGALPGRSFKIGEIDYFGPAVYHEDKIYTECGDLLTEHRVGWNYKERRKIQSAGGAAPIEIDEKYISAPDS